MHNVRLSAGIRFIYAVLRLSADLAEGFGQAVISILKKQYPDMLKDMSEDPQYKENAAASIGHKMIGIARKQLQYNDQDAYDAIQDLLSYIISSKFDFRAETKKGKPGAETWRKALDNIYANLRSRAMSHSFKKFKSGKHTEEELYADLLWRKKMSELGKGEGGKSRYTRYSWSDEDQAELDRMERALESRSVDTSKIVPTKLRRKNVRDKTIDEAFGTRGEEGGAPSGGLGRIPQSQETVEGLPSDEKAAKKGFIDTLDKIVPDLMNELPTTKEGLPAQRFLFRFLFEEEGPGTFLPGVESNMGQATAFRDWLEQVSQTPGPNGKAAKDILLRYGKRWSGFVGDTRQKLMESIQDFTEKYMPEEEYDQLWNEFFSDASPRDVEKLEEKKELESVRYQRGIDLRKIIRMQEEDKLGMLTPENKTKLNKLRQKVMKEIEEEISDKTADAKKKFEKDMSKYEKDRDSYMAKMMQVQHLPIEKQPRFDRPRKPIRPDPADIRKSVPSLDEQLKLMMDEYGSDVKKSVEDEFKSEIEQKEQSQTPE